jgi:molybdopterin-binding protein
VRIGEEHAMKLSARNQIKGTVTAIKEGAVEAQVSIDIGGQKLTSVITMDAVADLGLSVGSEVVAVIKADHVMLAVE